MCNRFRKLFEASAFYLLCIALVFLYFTGGMMLAKAHADDSPKEKMRFSVVDEALTDEGDNIIIVRDSRTGECDLIIWGLGSDMVAVPVMCPPVAESNSNE